MGSIKRALIILTLPLLLLGCTNQNAVEKNVNSTVVNFFKYLTLEEVDPLMDLLVPDTEFYYEYYDTILNTFENYKYDYKINEIIIKESDKDNIIAEVKVSVSGINELDLYEEYDGIYTFEFVVLDNNRIKIEEVYFLFEYF